MPALEFRNATEADLPFLIALRHAARSEHLTVCPFRPAPVSAPYLRFRLNHIYPPQLPIKLKIAKCLHSNSRWIII
jgi:hypothetical protein